MQPGQLFIPLVAERDGHDFIEDAVRAGAGAFISHRDIEASGDNRPSIRVENTAQALRQLGAAARAKIAGPVVAITGSVGKTSTKDLLAGAVSRAFQTHSSAKSFNNEIGVPLTLLNAPDTTELGIIEMGARGVSHVAHLCDITSPTIGIITTVVGAHTGEFGSVENIAVGKGELVEALPENGLAVLNGDNPLVRTMESRTKAPVLNFGHGLDNDVRIESVELDSELGPTFTLVSDWGRIVARPPTRGAHMATNTAAAAATALWLGVSIEAIEEGFTEVQVSPWRMDVQRAASGALIINDSYNANPASMRGAIDSLGRLENSRKVAVLGYMGELGDDEIEHHLEIAEEVRLIGAELITVGTELYGVETLDEPDDVVDVIGSLTPDTAVLVKGSRSAGLETLAEALLSR